MLTELHGGRFEIESVLATGTTVRVILPAERILAAPGLPRPD
jgi:signal transduction histidine kinase